MATVDVHAQSVVIRRGGDYNLVFSPPAARDITGWALDFNLVEVPGLAVALTVATPTITFVAATGVITVPLTAAQTWALSASKMYAADLWRTGSGTLNPLATLSVVVVEPVRRYA
jgi:hypothetical protein